MVGGGTSYPNIGNNNTSNLQKIFLHARNTNLLWRYEILEFNGFDATQMIGQMEDDIFWDLSEINIEEEVTKSLRMTNMGLKKLPSKLSLPLKTQIIDLSGNMLTEIPEQWSDYFDNLKILRIANNEFTSIPWEVISNMSSIRILDMRNNPWKDRFLEKFKSYLHMFVPNLQSLYL